MEMLRELGLEVWFNLGDRDLALCLERRRLLDDGATLSEAHAALTRALGVSARVIPMSDDPVRTTIASAGETIGLQEFLIGARGAAPIDDVIFEGATHARGAAAALAAIASAEAIVIGPSNPILSIGPILAVAQIRAAIEASAAPGRRGQPDRRRRGAQGADRGLPGVGRRERRRGRRRRPLRRADRRDRRRRGPVEGVPTLTRDTRMDSADARRELAPRTLELALAAAIRAAPLMRTLAILPVKRFELAKTRLGERARPRRAPARSRRRWSPTCSTRCSGSPALDGVVVVTNEAAVAELAGAAGARRAARPARVRPERRGAGRHRAGARGRLRARAARARRLPRARRRRARGAAARRRRRRRR